jgi:hypothetical protein
MQDIATSEPKSRLFSRRRFAKLGAGGVMAATALATGSFFGADADAAEPGICEYLCCELAHCPPGSYSYCSAHANYIWGCYNGSQFCYCCEANNYTYSAISCDNG